MKFLSINWRRGFFRLWLFLALLWCGVGFFFTGGAFLTPYVYTPTYAYVFGLPTFPPEELEKTSDRAVAALRAANEGRMVHRTAEIAPSNNIAMFFPADVPLADADFAADYLVTRLRGEHAAAVESARWRNFGLGATWSVVPPLVLLGIGLVVGWILAGFRGTPVRKEPT